MLVLFRVKISRVLVRVVVRQEFFQQQTHERHKIIITRIKLASLNKKERL